jgi:hypothetical protein
MDSNSVSNPEGSELVFSPEADDPDWDFRFKSLQANAEITK